MSLESLSSAYASFSSILESFCSGEEMIAKINKKTIAKIKGSLEQGLQIKLFVGRTPAAYDLPLPKNEGDIWVSLSIDHPSENWVLDKERLHLIMNVNQTEQMKTIQGLFHTVVVDLSTTKFFDNCAFGSLVNTVSQGRELFFPSEFQFIGIANNPKDIPFDYFNLSVAKTKMIAHQKAMRQCYCDLFEKITTESIPENLMKVYSIDLIAYYAEAVRNTADFKEWSAQQDPRRLTSTWQKNPDVVNYLNDYVYASGLRGPSYEEEKDVIRQKTKEDLLEFFEVVDLCQQQYPYPNRYDNGGSAPTVYFHAQGRK